MLCLLCSAGCSQPFVSRWTAGIKMGADQPYLCAAEHDGRCYCDPSLKHERKLYSLAVQQWQSRKNGVATVTLRCAVSHGRCVAKVHAQALSCFYNVLLSGQTRNKQPANSPVLYWFD